jgi:putative DNA primase/helicase
MTQSRNELGRALKTATALLNWCLKSEAATRINAMIDLARSEPGIPILPEQLDTNPWLLNCVNGTLDLRTGQLREHRREDLITKLCPIPHDPKAVAPTWDQFLQTIFADKTELVSYIQRFLGYCLTGDVSEHILPLFWGTGANGKSTLLNIILAMLGSDYAIKAASDLLMMKRDTHPTERADLFGKRFVVCIESDENRRFAESLVKDLTGGDRQRARRMREDFWEFAPTHKVILCTNHKPIIRGTDIAIWRRIRLIPFTVTIPCEQQDKRLGDKLKQELPGILAWCVRGCQEWQREGLGMPAEVTTATAVYRSDEDILGAFLSECCVRGADCRISARKLYACYTDWCEANGEKCPVTQKQFGTTLTERGFERYQSNGTWYRGVTTRVCDPTEGWNQRNHFCG